jgi:hypothetical protein
MSRLRPRALHGLGWLPIIALLVAWAGSSLALIPDLDHGVFLWVGHVLRGGGLPYVDSIETKGPIAYAIWALIFVVAPVTEATLRAADALFWVGAMWLTARTMRELWPNCSRHVAVTAAVFLGAIHVGVSYGSVAQPDEWGGWFVLASLAVALRAASWRGACAAGALAACAAGIKPSFALFGAVPMAAVVWQGTSTPARVRQAGAVIAGWLGAVVVVLGVLVALGAYDAFVDVHLRFNLEAYAGKRTGGADTTWRMFWSELQRPFVLLSPLGALGAVRLWRAPDAPRARAGAVALVVWLVLAGVNTAVQGKYWFYHYLPGAPALALLGAAGLAVRADARRWRLAMPAVVSLLAIVATGAQFGMVASFYRRLLTGDSLDDWFAWGGARTNRVDGLPRVGAYIGAATPAEAPVLIFAQDAALYHYADRWPATRFGINLALILGQDRPQRQRFRREFMQDVTRRPPARIVLWDDDRNALLDRSSREYLREFPEFRDYLATRYARDTVIGRFEVLRPR